MIQSTSDIIKEEKESGMRKRYLEIGKIVGTHGLRGEMRVEPWCDTPAFFCRFETL